MDLIILKNSYFQSKQDLNLSKYRLFSSKLDGQVFQRVFDPELERFSVGAFSFNGVFIPSWMFKVKPLVHLYFAFVCIARAMQLRFQAAGVKYVLATDPHSSGVIAYFVSRVLGAKLVTEMNGNSGARKTWGADSGSVVGLIKYHYCQIVIPFILSRSFAVKLLYPQQLDAFRKKINHPNLAVFHEFVPIQDLQASDTSSDYILFMGTPWHAKGLDLLIKAFNFVGDAYPGYLKIVGYLSDEDRKLVDQMINGNTKIQIQAPVFYQAAQEFIHHCDFFVLPSRTEAMGRVLIESMAHKKAVIGSSADGIPTYVKDNEYGLIFESGNWEDLAEKLQYLIQNPALKTELAEKGNYAANHFYSESAYLDNYSKLLMLDADDKKELKL